ncbi:alpha/beta hydrolase [Bacillus cereus]|uniref:Alpha/beta hydrolase n=1 Tax=Bacillus cereus TaxID=1396 RepID=A0A2B0MC91_BACCE|nr:alpha/beta hydrolase [Bacillus cereus]
MFFSKVIDLCALYDMHRKRSKEFQYNSNSVVILNEDIKSFYKINLNEVDIEFDMARSEDKRYEVGKFKYKSSIQLDNQRNDIVTGEVFIHDKESPNIVFVHGWRMDSNERVKKIFHDKMLDLTWNMYYFTLPYHFEREPKDSLYSGEFMVSANIERTVKCTQQAVVDLRALIQWIKENKKGPVILIGVSLGGFITNLTSLVESEIDGLVSVFYANRLSYSIWNTVPGKYIRKDLEHHGVTYEGLKRFWKITEPSQALPVVSKEQILLISGKHDQYVLGEDTDYLWETWGKPTRYIYNCGHAGIVLKRNKIVHDTIQFIRKRILEI